MALHDVLAGIAIAIGLVGIVVPVIPGLSLTAIAVVLWAFEEGETIATILAVTAVAVAVAVTVLKYLHPGRKLRQAGIPRSSLFLAVAAGTIGLFVIPVVGGPLLFVAAIYLLQRRRVGGPGAWNATRNALGAIALSIGIELAGGFVIAGLWLGVVLLG